MHLAEKRSLMPQNYMANPVCNKMLGVDDAVLYRAKHEGQNRVVYADDPTVENIAHQEATL